MRNYKLKTQGIYYGIFGNKPDFTDEQKQQLKDLGFRLEYFDTTWQKSLGVIYDVVYIELIPSKSYLYFYQNGIYFLPCELNSYVKNKELLKMIKDTVKELKDIGVI